uniref:Uncharacterized protein n=1 Tax=Oryzias latipes TaxID=8090 RepID=A0A3P9KEP6_ORYLA
ISDLLLTYDPPRALRSSDPLLACTPSPCRGNAHLGRLNETAVNLLPEQPRDCWQMP